MNWGYFVLHTSLKSMAKTLVSHVAISSQLSVSPSKIRSTNWWPLKHLWTPDRSQKVGKVKRGNKLLAVLLVSSIIYQSMPCFVTIRTALIEPVINNDCHCVTCAHSYQHNYSTIILIYFWNLDLSSQDNEPLLCEGSSSKLTEPHWLQAWFV